GPGQAGWPLRDFAWADLDTDRDAAHLPVVELEAGRDPVALVELHPDAAGHELRPHPLRGFEHRGALVVLPVDRHDHDLVRGQPRWQHEPLVITVDHDDRADEPGGQAPRRRPAVLELVTLVEALDVEGLG